MKGFFKKTTAAVTLNSSSASGGNTIPSALAKATANSTQPLQQQEMLFLLGASVREPPSMAAAWMERLMSVGQQAEACLKMLTVLHRLQARAPLCSPAHMSPRPLT